MRIVICTPLFDRTYSGVATFSRMLVEGVRAAGHDVTVVSTDCTVRDGFVPVRTSRWDVTPNRWLSSAGAYRTALASLGGGIDVVHFVDARESCMLPANCANALVVGSVHDTYSHDLSDLRILQRHFPADWLRRWLYYRLLRAWERRVYRRCDRLTANTGYVRMVLHEGYRIPVDRVETVYYGAPLQVIRPPAEPPTPYRISFVGGNFQRKGLLPLLKALVLLRAEGLDIALDVAGKDAQQPMFERIVGELGLSGHVAFHGYTPAPAIPALMRGTHVFAMPSVTEAFGLVYLEAMACGIPAIGSIHGGTGELIRDGENGCLADPDDPSDIARKIKRLLDPVHRSAVIEKGYETVERFSGGLEVARIVAMYGERRKVLPGSFS